MRRSRGAKLDRVGHPAAKIHFPPHDQFHDDLKARVEAYFVTTKQPKRGGAKMATKTAILVLWAVSTWTALMFITLPAPGVILGVITLALAMAGIGFAVMHDANHGAYSESARVNALFSLSLDLLGASSFHWRQAHNVMHHSYTNISRLDIDLEMSSLLRVAPWQERRPVHRFQWAYVSLLFALFPLKWWLYDDVVMFIHGRRAPQIHPAPRGWTLVQALSLKTVFLCWAFVIPALLHPTWWLIPLWLLGSAVLGNLLGWIFQLAHVVQDADFYDVAPGGEVPSAWARHQVLTTVDFARENRLVSWYLGGLNFQVEHHLFPQISHTHYPAIARIVEATCAEHGVRYRATRTFTGAFLENVRHLRRMGAAA